VVKLAGAKADQSEILRRDIPFRPFRESRPPVTGLGESPIELELMGLAEVARKV
jgi:hypothetical protein